MPPLRGVRRARRSVPDHPASGHMVRCAQVHEKAMSWIREEAMSSKYWRQRLLEHSFSMEVEYVSVSFLFRGRSCSGWMCVLGQKSACPRIFSCRWVWPKDRRDGVHVLSLSSLHEPGHITGAQRNISTDEIVKV